MLVYVYKYINIYTHAVYAQKAGDTGGKELINQGEEGNVSVWMCTSRNRVWLSVCVYSCVRAVQ